MTRTERHLATIGGYTTYRLANIAGCACPDSPESAGSRLLDNVRTSVAEAIGDRWATDDALSEIASDAPDVYTDTRWREFVDLAAYREECETGAWPEDLTDAAGAALCQITERLAHALASCDDCGERVGVDGGANACVCEEGLPEVPADFPVKVLGPDDAAAVRMTCGACGRSWDDAVVTSMTPAPSARCPFESFHGGGDDV